MIDYQDTATVSQSVLSIKSSLIIKGQVCHFSFVHAISFDSELIIMIYLSVS